MALDVPRPRVLVAFDPQIMDLASSTVAVPEPLVSFLTYLKENTKLSVASYDDKRVVLFRFDEPLYDTIVLLPTNKRSGFLRSDLLANNLLKLAELNTNIIVIGGGEGTQYSAGVRAYLQELGIYPSPLNHLLIDHFNGDKQIRMGARNVVAGNGIVSSMPDFTYTGGAAIVSNNQLLMPLVRADETAFTVGLKSPLLVADGQWASGKQAFVAAALQARNNARTLWLGLQELLESEELYMWAMQLRQKLGLMFVQHSRAAEPSKMNPPLYRVKEQAYYSVGISELRDGHWVPYRVPDSRHMPQVAFRMLDPYQRIDMQALGPAATTDNDQQIDTFVYYANLTVPDQHGVFTFEVDYARPGYTFLKDERAVSVRHLANDEFKRSWEITNAWVYVASSGMVVMAWLLFVVIYIYVSNPRVGKKNM